MSRDVSQDASPLDALIRRIVAREGPLTVARYMALALQHPEHGYYRSRHPIGTSGDFVTAPEVSQMFGELVGLWAADLWLRSGRPDPVALVELGPGRGTLMADALRAIGQTVPALAKSVRLHLIESNPALKAEQTARLDPAEPAWHDDLAGVPEGPAIVIANEFFDALPIRQFVRQGHAWVERVVTVDPQTDRFAFALAPAADPSGAALARRLDGTDAEDGAIVELSPEREALAGDLARRVARDGGGALIVDYGNDGTDRNGTLQAVRGHARHDVLDTPGGADLTAHVDFAALRAAAEDAGAAVFGPVEQGVWLTRLGIGARLDQLVAGASPETAEALRAGHDRLIGANAMGRLFKALAIVHPDLGRSGLEPPAGFDA